MPNPQLVLIFWHWQLFIRTRNLPYISVHKWPQLWAFGINLEVYPSYRRLYDRANDA